ncbi:hypothetical protein D3C75_768670 [compost metagenome]
MVYFAECAAARMLLSAAAVCAEYPYRRKAYAGGTGRAYPASHNVEGRLELFAGQPPPAEPDAVWTHRFTRYSGH